MGANVSTFPCKKIKMIQTDIIQYSLVITAIIPTQNQSTYVWMKVNIKDFLVWNHLTWILSLEHLSDWVK